MTVEATHTAVIIVAAGVGHRFGSDIPKQFVSVGGRPLLLLSIERMRAALPGAIIIVALHPDYFDLWHSITNRHSDFDSTGIILTQGGSTRWHSVALALAALPAHITTVMVHDAARPLVSPLVVGRLMQSLTSGAKGVVPAVAVSDSLRAIEPGCTRALDRSAIRAVQTPQAFPRAILTEAYALPYTPAFTDDASVVEALHPGSIEIVEGCVDTLKITHPADIATLQYILAHEH